MSKPTVLLADDHKILRDGIKSLLETHKDIEIIGEAGSGREAVEKAVELKPDIVIIDIAMPDLNGIEAAKKIKDCVPGIKIIALSMHKHKRYISEMFKAGASGYLHKESAFEELLSAIYDVKNNKIYISPAITDSIVEDFIHPEPIEPSSQSPLTEREKEVLRLLAEGNNVKTIASLLDISTKTVHVHRRHIMEKLDLHNLADLTRYALEKGLI